MFSYGIEVTDDDSRATLTNWCGLGSIVNGCVFSKWSGAIAELTAEALRRSRPVRSRTRLLIFAEGLCIIGGENERRQEDEAGKADSGSTGKGLA